MLRLFCFSKLFAMVGKELNMGRYYSTTMCHYWNMSVK